MGYGDIGKRRDEAERKRREREENTRYAEYQQAIREKVLEAERKKCAAEDTPQATVANITPDGRTIVTIEKTSKKHKKRLLLAGALVVLGIFARNEAVIVAGIVAFVYIKIAIWWDHG